MRPPGWFRLVRGGVFAAVCVALSGLGHDLMAARPAPHWAGWTALAVLGGLGYHLADRRRPAWWILLAVEGAQAGLHVWFSCCTPAGPATAPMRMPMPGTGAAPYGGAAMFHGAGISPGMVIAHALAGALAAAWLYAGERALWRALRAVAGFLVDRTRRALAWLVAEPAAGPRPAHAARARRHPGVAPQVAVLRHALVRRGPPPVESAVALTSG